MYLHCLIVTGTALAAMKRLLMVITPTAKMNIAISTPV
jgi:hypothetical protein